MVMVEGRIKNKMMLHKPYQTIEPSYSLGKGEFRARALTQAPSKDLMT